MGIHVIRMPDIGEGIAEVELVEWHVKPGDSVTEDQALADVMTDKANVEIPTPVAGKILALGGKPGDVLAVGAELIRIEVEGAGNFVENAKVPVAAAVPAPAAGAVTADVVAPDGIEATAVAAGQESALTGESGTRPSAHATPSTVFSPKVASGSAGAAGKRDVPVKPRDDSPASGAQTGAGSASRDASVKPAQESSDKPIASPAVRRRAWDLGIELQFVAGSGPAGRIMHEDLDAYAARGASGPDVATRGARYIERHDEEAIPVIGLRRKIAQKMQEAKRRIPHFTYVEEVDVTELEALRAKLNAMWSASRGKLTMLPFLMRAIVRTVPTFPQINARYDDDGGTVTRYGAVHLGIATQTDGGLMVPVVRHAEARDLWSCAAEVARLSEAARSGKALREELSGSTITITSLGALGGIVTTPVINYPEVAIVGVNRIVERPVIRAGAIVPRLIMNLSSSFDHRVVDGMHGAEFVQALRGYLENPGTLFIE
ncbi:MAG: dihydrolipoamide acetyltransferase family protein [Betaproteobacteria bacterium]